MAFKPMKSGKSSGNFEDRNYPTPKAGSRKARVSLIVDLGIQVREDFEDPNTKELKPQKPCQQVVVFADLVADVVDYGGKVGKAQYRLLLNKSYGGEVYGVNFTSTPPRDKAGKMIEGKEWGFHPANLLTKLAKAVGKPGIITSMDIEELLDMPFMADVEITEKESEKEDKDGNPIIHKYVNFKGASKVPLDDDDNPVEIKELTTKARCITFDNATVDDIQFLRGNIIKMIKLAENYAGSKMQKAIEAFEAKADSHDGDQDDDSGDDEPSAPVKTPAKTAPAKKVAKKVEPDPFEDDSDIPF